MVYASAGKLNRLSKGAALCWPYSVIKHLQSFESGYNCLYEGFLYILGRVLP